MQNQESPRLFSKELVLRDTLKTWKSQELIEYDSQEEKRSPTSLFDCLVNRPYNSEELIRNLQTLELNSASMCLEKAIVPEEGQGERQNQSVEGIYHNENLSARLEQPQSDSGCNCPKCTCIKSYCSCWEKGISCTQKCRCINCHNQQDHKQLPSTPKKPILFTVQKCSCKKSKCQQMHCSCHQGNRRCTSYCLCVGCENTDENNLAPRSMHTRSCKLGSIPSQK